MAAVKGIGGFHLCCDATNEQAVQKLRKMKFREEKPLAVMMKNLETVQQNCQFCEEEERILTGAQKPILLLAKSREYHLAYSVVKENPKVGVMLPYTPLHMLLFSHEEEPGVDALVMTSCNLPGVPISRTDEEAQRSFPDCMLLSHNREILIQADDSVAEWRNGSLHMIRRSRGYVPLPVGGKRQAREGSAEILAAGGEMKNTFCIGKGGLFYLSPYIGEMDSLKSAHVWEENTAHMQKLLKAKPEYVVCDSNPQYQTSSLAERLGIPVIQIQHHFAHIVSCMAENEYEGAVIGVAMDGTGYGDDGSIWGGEILMADRGSYTRLGNIMPFWQAGGDRSAREGWRIAASLIHQLYGERAGQVIQSLELCEDPMKRRYAENILKLPGAVSTSAGRLFDAVSAVLGICRESSYEGEAAAKLQFAAERFAFEEDVEERTEMFWKDGIFRLPTDALFRNITEMKLQGYPNEELAYRFHRGLAHLITEGCITASEENGIKCCALSGGVFQNQLLSEMCEKELRNKGFCVLTHHMVPANDGGLALGQAVAAAEQIRRKRRSSDGI